MDFLSYIHAFRKDNEKKEWSFTRDYVQDMIKDWFSELDLIEEEYWNVRKQFDSLIYGTKKIKYKKKGH